MAVLSRLEALQLLGLQEGASTEDVRRAFRQQALLAHPDKNREEPAAATERFHKLLSAYAYLTSPKQYNALAAQQQPPTTSAGFSGRGVPFQSYEELIAEALSQDMSAFDIMYMQHRLEQLRRHSNAPTQPAATASGNCKAQPAASQPTATAGAADVFWADELLTTQRTQPTPHNTSLMQTATTATQQTSAGTAGTTSASHQTASTTGRADTAGAAGTTAGAAGDAAGTAGLSSESEAALMSDPVMKRVYVTWLRKQRQGQPALTQPRRARQHQGPRSLPGMLWEFTCDLLSLGRRERRSDRPAQMSEDCDNDHSVMSDDIGSTGPQHDSHSTAHHTARHTAHHSDTQQHASTHPPSHTAHSHTLSHSQAKSAQAPSSYAASSMSDTPSTIETATVATVGAEAGSGYSKQVCVGERGMIVHRTAGKGGSVRERSDMGERRRPRWLTVENAWVWTKRLLLLKALSMLMRE